MHVTWNEILCRYSPEIRRNAPEACLHIWFFDDTEKVCTKLQFSPPAPEVLRHGCKKPELRVSRAKIPASFQSTIIITVIDLSGNTLRVGCSLLCNAEKVTSVSETAEFQWIPPDYVASNFFYKLTRSQTSPCGKKNPQLISQRYCYWWNWVKNTP